MSIAKRKSLSDVLDSFRKVHGDRYDYSKVEYVNSFTKVTIVCSDHGEFTQTPDNHLKGKGCPKCVVRKKRIDQVLEGFRKRHGDRYDYSKVEYVDNNTHIIIICPDHGEFSQRPRAHLSTGCPKCWQERNRSLVDDAVVARVHALRTTTNMTMQEIATEIGVRGLNRKTVSKILNGNKPRVVEKDTVTKVFELRSANMSMQDIGTELGLRRNVVSDILNGKVTTK